MIGLRAVAKRFPNGVEALRDLSFIVADKEFVSLLGPSGCGKSTTLRLWRGCSRPTRAVSIFRRRRPEIGFVFQEPTLMPWADAQTNARLPLDLKHVPRGEAGTRAAECLARSPSRVLNMHSLANCPAA